MPTCLATAPIRSARAGLPSFGAAPEPRFVECFVFAEFILYAAGVRGESPMG